VSWGCRCDNPRDASAGEAEEEDAMGFAVMEMGNYSHFQMLMLD
jgi:hypothetical protein